VEDESAWYGKGKKLTPPYPQKPEVLIAWLAEHGYEIKVQTGIRVFHDYMHKGMLEETDIDELMKLEYRYCREPVYRDMGRYIHILARKTTDLL
jgi:S-adenosylmethionine-dependent methyltransferase